MTGTLELSEFPPPPTVRFVKSIFPFRGFRLIYQSPLGPGGNRRGNSWALLSFRAPLCLLSSRSTEEYPGGATDLQYNREN